MESMSEKWVLLRTDLILGKRKKSHGARSGEYGGVFQNYNVSKKLTNTQGCVIRSVIVMERLCVGFPKRSASCHALSHKALKNVFIDGLVHCLALG